MRVSAIIPALALASQAAAQFNGLRSLSVNMTAMNIDPGAIGGGPLVSYAYNSLWIGAIKQSLAAEPFLFSLPEGAASPNLQFLSFHAYDFEQGVNAYVLLENSAPIQWTNLHDGGGLPLANYSTFSLDSNGYLVQSGENKFYGCANSTTPEDSYEIFWIDNGIPAGYNCTGPLLLTTSLGCTTQ